MMNLIIGGAGFIGKSLTKRLKESGEKFLVVDIGIWQSPGNLGDNLWRPSDLKWSGECLNKMKGISDIRIWHLAANSDIAKASTNFEIDYELTLGSTIEVLKVAEKIDCSSIEFTSSSAVYGNRIGDRKFQENDPLVPISNYGNMKAASETLIRIFADRNKVPFHNYRLANIVGPNMTHGLIFDLVNKIRKNSSELQVLGNGMQRKTYLHVDDLISVMSRVALLNESLTLNVGPSDEGMTVAEIVNRLLSELEKVPQVMYEKKTEGWHGDVTNAVMDNTQMKKILSFEPRGSSESIQAAIKNRLSEVH
jgi:UDP-glucose 4-epimerase